MKQQQAIEILKQLIDECLKSGVIKTLEAAEIVNQAFKTIMNNDQHTDSN